MSEPAQPFIRVSASAGYNGDNLPHLAAWLQSDAVRTFRSRPTRLDAGADVFLLMGGGPTVRVDADDADPDMYPTGERQSPRDDLTFALREASDIPADSVYLLQQVPPGPSAEGGTDD
jgi:hypothetical protein